MGNNLVKKALFIVILPLLLFATLMFVSMNVSYLSYGIVVGTILLITITYGFGVFTDASLPSKVQTSSSCELSVVTGEIDKLIKMADDHLLIVSGNLDERIWGTEDIISDLKTCVLKDISIQILCQNQLYMSHNSNLYKHMKEWVADNRVKLFFTDGRPERHFTVVDSMHVRLEKPHELGANECEALIKKNAFHLASRATMKFQAMRAEAIPITGENLDTLAIFVS